MEFISLLHVLVFFVVCTESRNPYKQPFASNSIWNLPLGTNAEYVWASIPPATSASGFISDADVIVLTPTAPALNYSYSNAGWNKHLSRCSVTRPTDIILTGPTPRDFIIPGTNGTLGGTPNAGLNLLQPDNRTITQCQPAAKCKAGGTATCQRRFPNADLYGDGREGAHGGSSLSAIGGTIRLGELVPGGKIPHVIKLEFFAHKTYWKGPHNMYRWPAYNCDGYANKPGPLRYGGDNPYVTPGSLLALNDSVDIAKLDLKTEPAKMVAWTLKNYGAYIVDDAAWSVNQVCVEYSPEGYMKEEFEKVWGYPFNAKNNDWAHDVALLMSHLSVVKNWDASLYTEVAASDGRQGAGGGAPLQPWATPINPGH